MIVRPADARVSHVELPPVPGAAPRMVHLSEGGGMEGLLVCHETLGPGAPGGSRYWSEHVDEVLYVLVGELTVTDDDGTHTLGPGDAAVWPAGVPSAHAVENRSGVPCSYLRVRTRPERNVCHVPGEGIRLEDANGRLRIIRAGNGVVPGDERVD